MGNVFPRAGFPDDAETGNRIPFIGSGFLARVTLFLSVTSIHRHETRTLDSSFPQAVDRDSPGGARGPVHARRMLEDRRAEQDRVERCNGGARR